MRLTQETGRYRITVFTAPTPIRVGPVDVSVLIQDRDTGEPLTDANAHVKLTPRDQPSAALDVPATSEAATNKLLRAAIVMLPGSGWWTVRVAVAGPHGSAQTGFEVEVGEPLPRWQALWPWFSWPAVVVLLFGVQQVLVQRRSR